VQELNSQEAFHACRAMRKMQRLAQKIYETTPKLEEGKT